MFFTFVWATCQQLFLIKSKFHTCIHVCVYVHMHVCIFLRIQYVCIHLFVFIFTCMYASMNKALKIRNLKDLCMHLFMRVLFIYAWMYKFLLCVYSCMYVFIYVCMHDGINSFCVYIHVCMCSKMYVCILVCIFILAITVMSI